MENEDIFKGLGVEIKLNSEEDFLKIKENWNIIPKREKIISIVSYPPQTGKIYYYAFQRTVRDGWT